MFVGRLRRTFSFKALHEQMDARKKFVKEASRFNEKFERKCTLGLNSSKVGQEGRALGHQP
jgi:hypothetical protein